jgi:hypothetical protein
MRVFLAAADIDYFIMLNLYGFCIQVYPRVAKYKEIGCGFFLFNYRKVFPSD